MSNREDLSAGCADCQFHKPSIVWGSKPSGELVKRVFKNWGKGELHAAIEDALDKDPIALWEICEEVSCRNCPCLRRGDSGHVALSPLFRRMSHYYFELLDEGHRLRRLVIVLNILGVKGARPGGYLRKDLQRIAGSISSASTTDKLIDKLCALGILRREKRPGRAPRFKFTPAGNSKLGEMVRLSKRHYFAHEHVKRLSCEMKREPVGSITPLSVGDVIGVPPPGWFLTYVHMIDTLRFYAWKRLLVNHELVLTQEHPAPHPSRSAIAQAMHSVLNNLLMWTDSMGDKEVAEWDAFIRRCREDERCSLHLVDLCDYEALRYGWDLGGPEYLYAGENAQACLMPNETR